MEDDSKAAHLCNVLNFKQAAGRCTGMTWETKLEEYAKTLSFAHNPMYKEIVDAIPVNTVLDETCFNNCMRTFLVDCCLITPLEASNFRTYLLNGISKTHNESVLQLKTFISSASLLVPLMSALTALTVDEQKIGFYNGTPPKPGVMPLRTLPIAAWTPQPWWRSFMLL
jgi:hypothetical protein